MNIPGLSVDQIELHFHLKDGKRWADSKHGAEWGAPIEIPIGATSKKIAAFLKSTEVRYKSMTPKKLKG